MLMNREARYSEEVSCTYVDLYIQHSHNRNPKAHFHCVHFASVCCVYERVTAVFVVTYMEQQRDENSQNISKE